MGKLSGLSKGKKILALTLEVLFFVILVSFLALRQGYYFDPGGPRPNVVILLTDSLRADHMSCYGHPVKTSPFIDKLAEKGVLFENARSQSTWTLPSVANLFTSLYNSEHKLGISYKDPDYPQINKYGILMDELITLPEVFHRNGYYTMAFVTNDYISEAFNFNRGFDEFFDLYNTIMYRGGKPVRILNLPANRVHEKLEKAISEYTRSPLAEFLATFRVYKKPLFIYVHYMDVHYPYRPPMPFATIFDGYYSRQPDTLIIDEHRKKMKFTFENVDSLNFYISKYDAQIRFFDSELEKLISRISENEALSETIFVFTSDHGEAFNEHGNFNHGGTPYEELIRIPLIFWGTEDFPARKRIAGPVEIIDIAPTLLEAAGIDIPSRFEGKSLLNKIHGKDKTDEPSWSENYSSDKPYVVMIDDNKKWYYNVRKKKVTQVYDLTDDPGEQADMLESIFPERVRKVADFMSYWRRKMINKIRFEQKPAEAKIPDEMRRKLKALGYMK